MIDLFYLNRYNLCKIFNMGLADEVGFDVYKFNLETNKNTRALMLGWLRKVVTEPKSRNLKLLIDELN